MKPPRFSRASSFAVAVASLLAAGAAGATTLYWDGTGTGWDAVGSWSTALGAATPNPSVVPGASDIANFSINTIVSTDQTVNLNGDQSAQGLIFLGTNASPTTLLGGSVDSVLTLGANGIDVQSSAGPVTIGSATVKLVDITLSSAQTWNNSSSSDLTIENSVTNGGHLLTVNGDGGSLINGAIAGLGGLTKTGVGTLTLLIDNTYSGATTVNGGELKLNSATALPGGIEAIGGTSSLTLTGAVIGLADGDFSRGLGTGVAEVKWTGDGGFAAYGVDRIVNLGGAAGTAVWGDGGSTITSFVPNGSKLILGSEASDATLTFANPIDLNDSSLASTRGITVNKGTALVAAELSGIISNGSLTKDGAGTLKLSGANTYIGTTTINGGEVILSNADALPGGIGSDGISALTLNGGVIGLADGDFTRALGLESSQVQWVGDGGFAAYSVARTVNLGGSLAKVTWGDGTTSFVPGGSSLILGSAGANNTLTFANPIDLNGQVRTVRVDNGSATFDAALTGVLSSGGLTKTGEGNLKLSNTNTYSGLTTVSAGVLSYGITNALNGDVTVNGQTAKLDLLSFSDTVGTVTLSGGGTLTGNSGKTLTTTGSFEMQNGTVSIILAGASMPLNKTSTGSVTLSKANTYTGLTTVTEGVLSYGINGAISTGAVTVNGGTLALGSYYDTVGTVTLASGSITGSNATGLTTTGSFEMQSGSVSAKLAGTMPLNKTTAGTVTLSAANTYTGLTTVSEGTLAYGINSALSTGAVTVSGGTLALDTYTDTVGTVTLTSGSITGTGTSGILTASTGNTFEMQSGSVTAVLDGTNIPLNKTTAGMVTLSNTNTYTGLTTVSAGTLAYGISDAISTGAVTVSGGTLALGSYVDSVGTVTLASGSITGTGTSGILAASTGNTFEMQGGSVTAVLDGTNIPLNKTTAGMVTLSNTNTYTGLTTVSAGTLAYGINDAISTGAVTVSGGTFSLGSYTDSVGTVTLASGSITGTGTSGILTSTGTFAVESGSASAVLAGTSIPLNKSTTGTVNLSNANTYSGNTTISAGKLSLVTSGSFNYSPVITVGTTGSSGAVLDVTAKTGGFTVLSGQTLKGIGTVNANNTGTLGTVVISGTHAPGNSVGIETIDGNVQYTGSSSIFEWELNTGAMGTRGSLAGAGGYDGVKVSGTVTGTVTGTDTTADAIFKVVLLAGSYGDGFWTGNHQWDNIFTGLDGTTATGNWTAAFGSITWYAGATNATGDNLTPPGYFSFTPATGTATGNSLYWTAVPEPSSALAGLLLGAGLLRRRRK